jgi:hypothetical protein
MYNRGSIPPLPLELWLGFLYDYAPQDPNYYYLSALLTVRPLPQGACDGPASFRSSS